MKIIKIKYSVLSIICILIFSSCFSKKIATSTTDTVKHTKNDTLKMDKQITKIIYHFGDSSVPPKYHRSYTITATKNKLEKVVDSYGEIISDNKTDISEADFAQITEVLLKSEIKNVQLGENTDCTGGTSERISYFSAKEELFSGSVYHCGGENFGTLTGDIKAVKEILQKFLH